MRTIKPFTHMFAIILIEMCDIFDNLLVTQFLKGLFTSECQYLPQSHGERPDVTFRREFALNKRREEYGSP